MTVDQLTAAQADLAAALNRREELTWNLSSPLVTANPELDGRVRDTITNWDRHIQRMRRNLADLERVAS